MPENIVFIMKFSGKKGKNTISARLEKSSLGRWWFKPLDPFILNIFGVKFDYVRSILCWMYIQVGKCILQCIFRLKLEFFHSFYMPFTNFCDSCLILLTLKCMFNNKFLILFLIIKFSRFRQIDARLGQLTFLSGSVRT